VRQFSKVTTNLQFQFTLETLSRPVPGLQIIGM
jgi:hypothetical protein